MFVHLPPLNMKTQNIITVINNVIGTKITGATGMV